MKEFSSLFNAAPYKWPLSGKWNSDDTAIIAIDMQRDFLASDGYFSSLGESTTHLMSAIEPAKKFLIQIRNRGFLLIHTRECHRPELVDLNENKRKKAELMGSPIGHQAKLGRLLVRGEWGSDFYDGFEPLPGEIVVDKPGNSAFYATDLDHILRVKRIRNIVLLGVTSDVCVSSTMRDANERGYDCLLLKDCCGAATKALHDAVIASLDRENGIFGAYCDSNELMLELERACS